jgi:glycosyltransferase involved in cell wall biosynthesis
MVKLSVILICYKQEQYIKQALQSIFMQKTNFNFELIIADDASPDDTTSVIEEYLKKNTNFNPRIVNISFIKNASNLGLQANYYNAVEQSNGDYIATLEGDDYWIDENKLQIQVNTMDIHPYASMSFTKIDYFLEDSKKIAHREYPDLPEIITFENLFPMNVIANLSCTMYRAKYIKSIPKEIMISKWTYEWFINMILLDMSYGVFINKICSVYRLHNSTWTGLGMIKQNISILYALPFYNNYFKNKYINIYKSLVVTLLESLNFDLIVIDGAFPNKLSGFRYGEFSGYLNNMDNILIIATQTDWGFFKDYRSIDLVIQEAIVENPKWNYKILPESIVGVNVLEHIKFKLLYFVFLSKLKYLEEKYNLLNSKIPFIFTLYPGGGFSVNHSETNTLLKQISNSPNFKGFITTQKFTTDYLINNKIAPKDKINFIYGSPFPEKLLNLDITQKQYFKEHKNTLDICFVAAKYMEKGTDKGYDTFIAVAKTLAKKYNNINFHVVGGFNEKDIDIEEIKDKITFYGYQETDWFVNFYKDKDIILSPNKPFVLTPRYFDGFPTASVADACLNGVIGLVSDELKMNNNIYKNNIDLIIVEPKVTSIIKEIETLYHNPGVLKKLSFKSYIKFNSLFNYKSQIEPRLILLDNIIKIIKKPASTSNDLLIIKIIKIKLFGIPLLKIRNNNNKIKIKLFGIPLLKIRNNNNKIKIKLFGIPLLKIRTKNNKIKIKLLGIPLLKIRTTN